MNVMARTRPIVAGVTALVLISASVIATAATTALAGPVPPPQKFVVLLKDGASAAQSARSVGVTPTRLFTTAVHGYVARLSATAQQQVITDPDVLMAVPDSPVGVAGTFHPQHVSRGSAGAADDGGVTPINSFPQFIPPNLARVGLGQGVTAPSTKGRGKTVDVGVAVVDSGIQLDNPELNVVGGTNCSSDATPGYGDVNGHGTEVAGVLAARDDGFGIVGVAPGAPLYSVRTLDANGDGETSDVVCALDWIAAHHAVVKVANLSLADTDTRLPDDHLCGLRVHDPTHVAVCRVVALGTTVVVAAGNDGEDITGDLVIPAEYPEVITTSGYADTDGKPGGVGGVCADGNDLGDDEFAPFSNYGQPADIAAVATCDYSTYFDGSLVVDNGTSFAAPAVAGAAALIYSRNPHAIPAVTELTLKALADHHPLANDPRRPNEGLLNLRSL